VHEGVTHIGPIGACTALHPAPAWGAGTPHMCCHALTRLRPRLHMTQAHMCCQGSGYVSWAKRSGDGLRMWGCARAPGVCGALWWHMFGGERGAGVHEGRQMRARPAQNAHQHSCAPQMAGGPCPAISRPPDGPQRHAMAAVWLPGCALRLEVCSGIAPLAHRQLPPQIIAGAHSARGCTSAVREGDAHACGHACGCTERVQRAGHQRTPAGGAQRQDVLNRQTTKNLQLAFKRQRLQRHSTVDRSGCLAHFACPYNGGLAACAALERL
jgi:hypothetical protein